MSPTAGTTADRPASPGRRRIGKKKWDDQPTQQAAVLIASTGEPIPSSAVRWALQLGGGEPVAVVSIARIYGSSLGLPNPGLMPSPKEVATQNEQVITTVRRIEKGGAEGWGQVAATRRPAKTISQIAKVRGVRHVLVVTPEQARWRQVVEGNLVRDIQRRVPDDVVVKGVTP